MYLGPYLGFYSILVIASSGGVCMCSCCGYCDYYRVVGAAIKVTSGAAIGITYSTAVRITGKISGIANRISEAFYGHCCGRCW